MQYDFDTILDRRGRDALALDMIPYDGVTLVARRQTLMVFVAIVFPVD